MGIYANCVMFLAELLLPPNKHWGLFVLGVYFGFVGVPAFVGTVILSVLFGFSFLSWILLGANLITVMIITVWFRR